VYVQLGVSALFKPEHIDGITTTLGANYTDITTPIYTGMVSLII
jgi:hypothetical protein